MILFKKKLILTALFITSAGMSVIDNSNATTNNHCSCFYCQEKSMIQQNTCVAQQSINQTSTTNQMPVASQTQGACASYCNNQNSNKICSSQGGFYLHGSFYGNGCNCSGGSSCSHGVINNNSGVESHCNIHHGCIFPCGGNNQNQSGEQSSHSHEEHHQHNEEHSSNSHEEHHQHQSDEQGCIDSDDQSSFDQSQYNQSNPVYEPYDFNINQYQNCKSEKTIISGHWRLIYNTLISESFSMENSIFEITKNKKFETSFNSMSRINLKSSTLFVDEKAKFVYQSDNFNTLTNGSEAIFGPYSRLIWNGNNYRLFDSSENSSFIIYPKAFINALTFDNVHKHNIKYLIDGNNEQSTLYLNRIDTTSSKNPDIMAVVLDMKVVLPKTYSKNDLKLDDSKQFLKIDIYPNLYFENCTFSFDDYLTKFNKEKRTDWMIKTNSKDYTGNKKAVLSCIEEISSYTSPDGSKFAKYDIDFGYANVNNISDNRESFNKIFASFAQNKYNRKSITIGGKEYNCYWDLSKLADSFKEGNNYSLQSCENVVGIFNYIPYKLYVGLIGNENLRLFSKCKGMGYDEVTLYGDNSEYTGKITASNNVNKIIFYDNSYADIDQLFKIRMNKSQCNCELRGSNEIRVNGQVINDLVVTKEAKTIKFISANKGNVAKLTIKGIMKLEKYESDEETTDDDSFIIEYGVEVNA